MRNEGIQKKAAHQNWINEVTKQARPHMDISQTTSDYDGKGLNVHRVSYRDTNNKINTPNNILKLSFNSLYILQLLIKNKSSSKAKCSKCAWKLILYGQELWQYKLRDTEQLKNLLWLKNFHPLHGEIAYQSFTHKKDISDRTALILQNTTLLKVGTTYLISSNKTLQDTKYCNIWMQGAQNQKYVQWSLKVWWYKSRMWSRAHKFFQSVPHLQCRSPVLMPLVLANLKA